MAVLVCLMVCCGPLVVALAGVLLVVHAGGLTTDAARGVFTAACSLGVVACIGASAMSALFRWCFVRPPVRGAALLTALLLGIFFLCDEGALTFIARTLSGEVRGMAHGVVLFEFLCSALVLAGLAVALCTILILIVELPVRWVQGDRAIVPDGALRMVRVTGVVIILVASASLLRNEGIVRLGQTIRRALG